MLDRWPAPLRRGLFRLVGVHWADRLLKDAWRAGRGDLHGMLGWLFRRNRFRVEVENAGALESLDSCIVAGNHPHGLFDALALAWMASRTGLETRIIARHFLNVFGPLRRIFLSVKLDRQRRSVSGRTSLDAAAELLNTGGRLVMTPAGGLSMATPFWALARDPQWRTGVIRLAHRTQKPIVLVDVIMPRSPVRQLLHRIHPIVRALAQVWAYRLGKRHRLTLRVVGIVHPHELPGHLPLPEQASWLQQRLVDPSVPPTRLDGRSSP